MNKIKEIYTFIKDKLKNKRTRALAILSLYFIFFLFMFLFIKFSSPKIDNTKTQEEVITNYKNINEFYNYEYSIEIEKTDKIDKYLLKGTNNNEGFTQQMYLYNPKTNNYEEILEYVDINSLFIDRDNIISYVDNLKEEFKTDYKDGTIQKNYLVSINKIDKNYQNADIEINVFEKDNFINKIVIDGTNLDNKSESGIISSKYTLIYTDINE